MNRTFPYNHPPTGLRSAVPLGGITTGSIELRGDGTFHEWTVESQSPAGAAKYGVVDDALLAIRLKNLQTNENHTRLLRTHPNHYFKGIDAIKYHGSYPVSKLELDDDTLIANMELYAYSILKPGDLNRSMTPAIIFSLNIHNPNDYPIAVDFMYNAPLSVQIDQTRLSQNVIQQVASDTYVKCISLCDQNNLCASWNWQNVTNQYTCLLYSDVGNNVYLSGQWYTWTMDI
jgi:non-lysosomal glucosylceramidase